jgi:hypothetical protein
MRGWQCNAFVASILLVVASACVATNASIVKAVVKNVVASHGLAILCQQYISITEIQLSFLAVKLRANYLVGIALCGNKMS